MTPDMINGLYELFAAGFIGLSCRRTIRDKQVKGVSLWHVGYFASWGFWNLFFYPYVGQWWSFWGGVAVVTANMLWLILMFIYRGGGDERDGSLDMSAAGDSGGDATPHGSPRQ